MNRKKTVLLATILAATLIAGVYALVLSNTITASWTLRESGTTLELYWADGEPTGDLNRGEWIQTKIGLRNNGLATYDLVTIKFQIYTSASALPTGSMTIEYNEGDGSGWHDMTAVLGGWGSATLNGYFGPTGGFPVDPSYDEQTWFRIMFDGDAPINVGYYFQAWVEEFA